MALARLFLLLFPVSLASADEAIRTHPYSWRGILKMHLLYTSGPFIGVNIGTDLSDMLSPTQVVALLKAQNIRHLRLYDTDHAMLLALANSGIGITVSVPNDQLLGIGQSNATAAYRVARNIIAHVPATNITAIAVGSEFIHSALVASNLDSRIKVSTPHSSSIIIDSFPPSQSTGSYLMLNVYPYYDYMQSNVTIPLDYALFLHIRKTLTVDSNTLLHYTNVFDAAVNAAYFAMSYLNFINIPIVVTESADATLENANIYNSNLIKHVLNNTGTPKHPGVAVSTYIYELYNEDQRLGSVSEKNWGLFDANGVPIYILHLTGAGTVLAIDTTNQTFCVAKEGADKKMLQAALVGLVGPENYEPDNVVAHATYAFNAYYQKMGKASGTYDFGSIATVTTTNPSHGSCIFPGRNGTSVNGTTSSIV
ncbi:hypothetical protein ACJRO7_028221 [Eucalyptus globulus]|uniref:glucan endo-1,3-beta-D-glucosidase n=1 Tax=Eucalyptus globulus TaxID=34317 RepID=A0ABD3K6M3_EUCGL